MDCKVDLFAHFHREHGSDHDRTAEYRAGRIIDYDSRLGWDSRSSLSI